MEAGQFDVFTPEGTPLTIEWAYGCQDPGWCKLDWVIAEPEKGRVVHASNMLDVTWETPDGEIVPLDGFLDPYFQEVYLDAESIPLFTKLVKQLSPSALQDYVSHWSTRSPSTAGAIQRTMAKSPSGCTISFGLTGRWPEAAFIRELFDEPAALLYQVAALLDTIDEARGRGRVPGSRYPHRPDRHADPDGGARV